MAENGDKERLHQLERRADKIDDALDARDRVCTQARLGLADRLGRIETKLDQVLAGYKARKTADAKIAAAIIAGIAGVVAAVLGLLF